MAVVVAATPQQDLNNLLQTAQAQQTQATNTTLAPTTAVTTPVTTAIGAPTTAPTTAITNLPLAAGQTAAPTNLPLATTAQGAGLWGAPTATAAAPTAAQGADIIMSAADQARIKALTDQWNAATAAGNTAGAQAAHDAAQALRATYGYSGGASGSQYIPTGTAAPTGGGDALLSTADRARITALQEQYAAAIAAGNTAGAQAAHDAAEAIRAQYGYSGGASGGGYTPVTQTLPQYTGTTLPTPQSGEQMIKDLAAAQQAQALQALQSAYQTNVQTANATAAKIPAQYQAAEQQTQQQAEIQRRNMNEQFAASGINVGAATQAQLSQTGALQRDLAGIRTAQANAMTELDFKRQQLETTYQNDVAGAIATGKFQEASALYDEFTRQQSALIQQAQAQADENFKSYQARMAQYQTQQENLASQAQTMASIGDFSGFAQLGYTQQQIDALSSAYKTAVAATEAAARRSTGGGGGGTPAAPAAPAPAAPGTPAPGTPTGSLAGKTYQSASWANPKPGGMIDPAIYQALGNTQGITNAIISMANQGASKAYITGYLKDLSKAGAITKAQYDELSSMVTE